MIWPWQRPIVEHRSSLTDQVDHGAPTASASGGGIRPALATSALEACATLYASALASCSIGGPSVVVRALDATWRASAASSLIRSGQCVYVIRADPVSGLTLAPAGHWDVYGSPSPATWYYRVRVGRGRPVPRGKPIPRPRVLHLRWLTDPTRPWAGISPLQRASDTGSLSGWIDKRLSEEASAPTGFFLPVARYDPSELDGEDDPLALLRADIGGAKGQVLGGRKPNVGG